MKPKNYTDKSAMLVVSRTTCSRTSQNICGEHTEQEKCCNPAAVLYNDKKLSRIQFFETLEQYHIDCLHAVASMLYSGLQP